MRNMFVQSSRELNWDKISVVTGDRYVLYLNIISVFIYKRLNIYTHIHIHTGIFHLLSKGKAVPLQTRGAQIVPGS